MAVAQFRRNQHKWKVLYLHHFVQLQQLNVLLLCLTQVRKQSVNSIQCLPLDDAPAKPQALVEFNQQQTKGD